MNQALAPFSCHYTSQIPELLSKLRCSLAISTYQAGKIVFISAQDENTLIQLPRTFEKPMGIAKDEEHDRLAIATKDAIIILANSPELAAHYPNAPQKYDALYMPRVTYHTGNLDIHDLSFGQDQRLFAVNTLFSTIVEIDSHYNFKPYWTPPFIDKLVSEDRCHLNGMALQNGLPKYVTAFNQGNTAGSWREHIITSGVLMDAETNETVLTNLGMPHSPRIFGQDLFVLLSATGELIKVDKKAGTYDVITKVEGFVRGMDLHQEYLFIGLSKLRKNSSTFAKLPFADKAQEAGIVVVHLPTGSIAGKITYTASLDEIYDIQVLPNKTRPNILNTIKPDYKRGLMTPTETFWADMSN